MPVEISELIRQIALFYGESIGIVIARSKGVVGARNQSIFGVKQVRRRSSVHFNALCGKTGLLIRERILNDLRFGDFNVVAAFRPYGRRSVLNRKHNHAFAVFVLYREVRFARKR